MGVKGITSDSPVLLELTIFGGAAGFSTTPSLNDAMAGTVSSPSMERAGDGCLKTKRATD